MSEENKQEEAPRIARVRRRLGIWTGLAETPDLIRSLAAPWKKIFRENRGRIRENLESRHTCQDASWQDILRAWGLYSEEDVEAYAASKQRWTLVGAFLLLFGGAGMFFQSAGGVVGFLNGFACLSVALLGAVLIITSLWRLQILNDRRFTPFDEWVTGWFSRKRKD